MVTISSSSRDDLALDRVQLDPRSLDPLFQCLDAFVDALDVAIEVVAARGERHLLTVHDFLHLGRLAQPIDDLGRKRDILLLLHLGLQPCIDRREPDAAQEQPLQLRPRRCVIEFEQYLSGLHGVAFAHEDLADHSALEMLNDLVLSGNDEHARRDHRAGYRGHVAPDAKSISTVAMMIMPPTVGNLVDRGSEFVPCAA